MRAETRAAIEAVEAVRPLLDSRRGAGHIIHKQPLDFATATDAAVERELIERLSAACPGCGFLGEETGLSGNRSRFWVLDPICGTINYALGLPLFNVNVALVEDGCVTIGVLLEPHAGRVFWAERGAGARVRDGDGERAIQASERSGTMSIDFGHRTATGEVDLMLHVMRSVMKERLWNVRVLGTSLVMACLADGRLAAHVVDEINAWDLCAGALIAEEAGAIVTDFAGSPWSYRSTQLVCAASRTIHAELLARIATFSE